MFIVIWLVKRFVLKLNLKRKKRINAIRFCPANRVKNAIWKIESGKVSPTIDTLEKIANALDINITNLVDVTKVDL